MHVTKKCRGYPAMCSDPKDKLLRMGCCIALVHIISDFAAWVASVANGHWIIAMDRVGEHIHRLASDDSRESSPSFEHLFKCHMSLIVSYKILALWHLMPQVKTNRFCFQWVYKVDFYLSTLKEKSRVGPSVWHLYIWCMWTTVCTCTRMYVWLPSIPASQNSHTLSPLSESLALGRQMDYTIMPCQTPLGRFSAILRAFEGSWLSQLVVRTSQEDESVRSWPSILK